ncbi:hypothetical protein PINS_up024443 [Pythium insidiosum]|nr:hypothetical protein PINS_up024443 [Pythium insidiosum]
MRFYPYVDLRRLRAGVPVIFGVPTWDFAWLKKYKWLFSNVDEKNVPSVYVESMRLYMPFDPSDRRRRWRAAAAGCQREH